MATQKTKLYEPSALKTIVLSGLVAGTLDMAGAIIVYAVIQHKTTAIGLMQYIASAVLGARSYSGGAATALLGLALHFLIAFSFASLYFFVYPIIPFLQKNKITSAVLYGLFVWIVMNLIVVPVAFSKAPFFTISGFLTGTVILMIMIGIPASFITSRYYRQNAIS